MSNSRNDIQNTIFAERLSELMRSGKVTQVMLAEGIAAAQPTISRYLAGQLPKAEELLKLARFFEVPMEVVLGVDAFRPEGEKPERRTGREASRPSASQPNFLHFEIRALREAASKLRKAAATLQANAEDLEQQANDLAHPPCPKVRSAKEARSLSVSIDSTTGSHLGMSDPLPHHWHFPRTTPISRRRP